MSTSNIGNILSLIAQKHLGIETLKTRNSDQLDFHDISVGAIESALHAAFMAGYEVGTQAPLGSVPEIVAPTGEQKMDIFKWDIDVRHEKFISWVKSTLPENERLKVFELVAQTGEYPLLFQAYDRKTPS